MKTMILTIALALFSTTIFAGEYTQLFSCTVESESGDDAGTKITLLKGSGTENGLILYLHKTKPVMAQTGILKYLENETDPKIFIFHFKDDDKNSHTMVIDLYRKALFTKVVFYGGQEMSEDISLKDCSEVTKYIENAK